MPQMSPMNWIILFIIFSIIFILFNIMNYYSFFHSPNQSNNFFSKINKSFNWKW